MNRSKKLFKALVVAGALAIPLGLAMPAQATTSSGCTVTPLTPVFAGFNASGVKLVDYRISVSCSSGRTVNITQVRYEQDGWPNPDDLLGTTAWSLNYVAASGATTLSNVRTLPNTDIGSYEQVYQQVHFSVSSGGVTSAYTAYQSSAVTNMHQ